MVLSVEKQKEVHNMGNSHDFNSTTINVKEPKNNSQFRRGEFSRREKENKFCSHCHNARHTRDTCFKLHEYLEWFKDFKLKK